MLACLIMMVVVLESVVVGHISDAGVAVVRDGIGGDCIVTVMLLGLAVFIYVQCYMYIITFSMNHIS